ncbi:hypothetical protein STBA_57330 [Streptomyces sp. MP131-18]|nr:hypothetical protein STBA_57330 [Streptomyces sp. MP131-18]
MRSRTVSAGSAIDSIPPRPASAFNVRLRSTTTFAASSSDRMPATAAAAISPCEWPTMALGTTPAASHTAASDTITAHNAGCTTSAASNPCRPASTSPSSHSTNGAKAAPHSASLAANTGEDSANSRPIPTHCEPCPGNTNTVFPTPAGATAPLTTPGAGWSVATAASPATKSSRPDPSTTARRSNTDRVVIRDRATSDATSSGRATTCPRSRSAWSARADMDRPESTNGISPASSRSSGVRSAPESPEAASAAAGSSAGASSRMRWALVPLIPNAEMPARRG